MLPYGFNWEVIKAKEGDDKIVALTPIEKSTMISLLLNLKILSEQGAIPQMLDDKDNFDASVDGLLQKLIL